MKVSLRKYAPLILALGVNLFFVYAHECWRDEAQAWLIARDNTIFSLFDVTSYEGHPFMWFYLLMPFARLGFPYSAIKFISLAVMAAVMVLIAVKAPLKDMVKSAFILSPFCIYCYVTPARNYCLCALFTVLAAMKYKDRDKQPLTYGLILAGTLQTHIIMAGFVVASCVEWFIEVLRKIYITRKGFWEIAGLFLPFLSGLFLLYEFRDTNIAGIEHPAAQSGFTLGTVKNIVWYIAIIVFLVLMTRIFTAGLKAKRRVSAPFFVIACAIFWQLWMNFFVYGLSNYRAVTWGYFLLWYVWVIHDTNDDLKPIERKITAAVVLVSMSLWFGVPIMYKDIAGRYSGAYDAALAVETLPEDAVIFEYTEDYCNSVIPYLKTKVIYNPFQKNTASYINRDTKLRHSMTGSEFMKTVREMFPDKQEIYMLMSKPKNDDKIFFPDAPENLPGWSLYYQDKDEGRILRNDEVFTIWRVRLNETNA